MSDGFSLIKADDISKPATVLIQKISDAVGGLYKPYQIRRVAKAEAEAEIIREQAQIKITNLQRRALARFVSEEAKKQDNIESITEKAIPQLNDSSNPQNMENDWITNFFDKCRIVSDEEMQLLWAKVLAGEANFPGTYSKRTVNSLVSLDKTDAQLFTNLCSFVWVIGTATPLIYDEGASIYNDQQIRFNTLTHLDDIGLISFESFASFRRLKLPQHIDIYYYGTVLKAEFKNPENNEMHIGKVLFSSIGAELARICSSRPIDGYLDYVIDRLSKEGLVLSSPYPRQQTQ
ncbi:MAG: DUF2806 domain-containing protein [Chloroflexi bacterium]|nr:DUF2806 domain-containing protein [Chloroflexota bacterium]